MTSFAPQEAIVRSTRSKRDKSQARPDRPFSDLFVIEGNHAEIPIGFRGDRRGFVVCMQIRGSGTVTHNGAYTFVGTRELFVAAPSLNIIWHPVEIDSRCIIVSGGTAFSLRFQSRALNAVKLVALHPLALLLGDCLEHLESLVLSSDPRLARKLAEALASLVDVAIEEANSAPSARKFLIKLARAESHLYDPKFDASALADICGITLRSLQKRFKLLNTTPRRWIRERRLEGIRKMLDDQSLANLTIRQIALRGGLWDFSHFVRSFEGAFGVSPGRYRWSGGAKHANKVRATWALDRCSKDRGSMHANRAELGAGAKTIPLASELFV